MPNAVRSRGGAGSRSPGLVDESAVRASGFHFSNKKSLRFDSNTTEAVVGPALSAVGTFTNVITVAIWHKWDPIDAGPTLYDSLCGAGDSYAAAAEGPGMYWQSNTTAHFHINGYNTNFAEAGGLDPDVWNFFVGVYDGNAGAPQLKLYVNGVEGATTDTYTGNINTDNNVEVGKAWNDMSGGGSDKFTVGNSDEFAIWDSALTQDEITEIYNGGVAGFVYNFDAGLYTSSANLRLWWRLGDQLDQDGTDGIVDQSGHGNHGTLTNITSSNFEEDVAGGGV